MKQYLINLQFGTRSEVENLFKEYGLNIEPIKITSKKIDTGAENFFGKKTNIDIDPTMSWKPFNWIQFLIDNHFWIDAHVWCHSPYGTNNNGIVVHYTL